MNARYLSTIKDLLLQFFRALTRFLFDPSVTVEKRQRPRVMLLSIYLFLVIFIMLSGAIAYRDVGISALTMLLATGYIISRTRHYKIALMIAIVAPILPPVMTVFSRVPIETAWELIWLSLPLLVASLFLTINMNHIVALVYLGLIVILGVTGHIELMAIGNILFYMFMVAFFVIAIAYVRDGDNAEVQLQLDKRIQAEKELRKANEALAEEAIRRRILIEQSSDGIVVLDAQGQVYEANHRFAEMLGYSMEEVRRLGVWDWEANFPRERVAEMLRTVDEEGDHFETKHVRKDGSQYDVEISTNGAVFAGQKLIFCVCRDITERKNREQLQTAENTILTLLGQGAELGELLNTIARLGELQNPSIEGSVLLFDSSRRSLYHYAGARMPDSYNSRLEIGIPIMPGGGSYEAAVYSKGPKIGKSIKKSPLFQPYNEVIEAPPGNGRLAFWSQPIISAGGDFLGIIAFWGNEVGEPDTDNLKVMKWAARIAAIALERKQVEMERERLFQRLQDKTKELEQIVYIASHDLRSPLINIQGFAMELEQTFEEMRTIANNGEITPTVREQLAAYMEKDIPEALKYVLAGTAKIDSLLSGLLRLSRLGREALDIQDLDMNEILTDIAHTLEFSIKNLQISLEVADLPHCQGDRTQINQVFSNLIDNAIKYRDPGRPCVIRITGGTENGEAIFCVEDNGIGIAREDQPKVFEIFQRLETNTSAGEGLGLSIVRRILDRHSGKIWLESEPSKGSRFCLSLPANGDLNERSHQKDDKTSDHTHSRRR
jgi:PAS domain S-box-containing protein